jgi:hypothetical protein
MTRLIEWGTKLFAGFLPTSGEKMGKIIWVAGISLLVLFATSFFQKPLVEKNNYNGQTTVVHDDPQVKYSSFGCTAGHVRAAVQWRW